jgi:hypothetical protein
LVGRMFWPYEGARAKAAATKDAKETTWFGGSRSLRNGIFEPRSILEKAISEFYREGNIAAIDLSLSDDA